MPTIDTDELSGRDLVLTLHPIMGPHDHWSTANLADEMAEYVRTLVHVTLPERYDRSLPYPSTIDAVAGSMASGLHRSAEIMGNLLHRLRQFDADPRVRDDAGGDVHERCAAAITAVIDARRQLAAAADMVTAVCRQTSHLGYDEPAEVEA